MIDSSQEALFGAALWEAALEKYACVTHLTVQLFDGNADLVLGPIHSTSIFQVFQDNHYDSGLFAQCARRCLQQTDHRPAVLISQTHGLATVGTSLMLEGTIVGAAVGGYVLSGFSQTLEIQALAREAGIAFTELWGVARKQAPVAQQRLLVYGELLQVLGDALLRENHRTRQYQQGVNALLASEERLRVLTDDLELLVRERTQELLASRDQLRGLSSELNLVEQRERKRMARELHDHLQQMLVLAKLKVGQSKRSSGSPQVSGEMLGQVDQLLTDSLEYTRTLVAELSPPVLHEFGLSAALKWLGEWMLKHNLNVTLQVTDDDAVQLPEDQTVLLFQSVRELLINSAKHAGTGQATVRVERTNGQLRIEVHDTGVGFDPDLSAVVARPTGGLSSGFGLLSIRERMHAIGGSFDLQSLPGKGTSAVLSVPLAGRTEMHKSPPQGVRPRETASGATVSEPSSSIHSARIRVLLVDDHAMVRQGLRTVLDGYPDIEVVGEAADGEEAVAAVARLQPAITVMDINMPKKSGIEATAEIKVRWPSSIIIGLTVNPSSGNQAAMDQAGAAMLLTKEAAVEELYQAIQQVLPSQLRK
ncbi:MAG: ATP-binding response regulator [Nitrospira sp.]